ncbi:MAG: hypothetical protein AB8B55_17250 [Mariniblastus sp.]
MSESPDFVIQKFLTDRSDEISDIALATRDAVLRVANKGKTQVSELLYVTYCVSDAFTYSGKLGQGFIHIATYANHVNLGFNRGAELNDPDNILQGTGKLIRHVRINSKPDLKTAPIKNLIIAAVEQGKQMAESKGGIQPSIFKINDSRKPNTQKKKSLNKKSK